MATVPSEVTAVAGTVLTAATWNSNVRDAINFLIAPPLAVLRQTNAQSIPTSAWTGSLFDTEDIDRDGGHSTTSNTSRYTAQTAGWYSCQGEQSFAFNATGNRFICFQINGSTRNSKVMVPGNGSSNNAMATAATFYLNVGDYAELALYQFSGAALNTVVTDDGNPRFQLLWVST